MGPQANAPSCTRRSFLLAALALAVTAPTRARALTTGLGFPRAPPRSMAAPATPVARRTRRRGSGTPPTPSPTCPPSPRPA